MAQSVYSTGNLFGIPAGANPTPVRFATLQDVHIDASFDLKGLYGGYQFPVEQARGKAKLDIKATTGRIDPALFNQIFFGLPSTSTGEVLSSVDETWAIPTTPFQVTTTNSATWKTDLGVYDTTLGKYKTRVSNAPTTGQYSVALGVYTFAAADVGNNVKISYTYTSGSTGNTITQTNTLLGAGIIFGLQLVEYYKGSVGGKSMTLAFPAVQASKLSMPMKLDDFTLPTFDMSAQDDGSGNVFTWSITG